MPGRREGDISATAHVMLERYLDELELWHSRVNLSSVPRAQAWERHIVEAMRLLDAASPYPGADVVDIGAGAGVPGIVIAVLRPDLNVTLVECDRRKAGFLVHVAGLLSLERITVDPRRAEDVARDPRCRERWDLAVSRAAAPPPRLCELALPLLRPGGGLWTLVGDAGSAAAQCAALRERLGACEPVVAAPGILHVRKDRLSPRSAGGSPPPPLAAHPRHRRRRR